MVGAAVLLPTDVLDLVVQSREQAFRLGEQPLQVGLLGPVLTLDLLDHQLGIDIDLNTVRLPLFDRLETFDEGVVLGLVVGHDSEPSVPGLEAHSLVVLDENPRRCGTGVASGGAVGPQSQCFQAITRIRPQLSQWTMSSPFLKTCIPDEVTVMWQAWHWLRSTSATGGWTRIRRYAFRAGVGISAQAASLSAFTLASSVCVASRSLRSCGSSFAERSRAACRCSDASTTAWSASSPSSISRSSASSSSAKLDLRC